MIASNIRAIYTFVSTVPLIRICVFTKFTKLQVISPIDYDWIIVLWVSWLLPPLARVEWLNIYILMQFLWFFIVVIISGNLLPGSNYKFSYGCSIWCALLRNGSKVINPFNNILISFFPVKITHFGLLCRESGSNYRKYDHDWPMCTG